MSIHKHPMVRFLAIAGTALGIAVTIRANPISDGPCERPPMPMAGMPEAGPLPPFLNGIELSDAQRDKIFELTYAQMPAMRKKAKALHQAHDQLRQLETSADYSDAKVKALTEANAKTMAEMAQMRARTAHAIYQILTPEQRKDMARIKTRFPDHDFGMPPPPPGAE